MQLKSGCPGCGCWGYDRPKGRCAWCAVIEPAVELFDLSVVRIVMYATKPNHSRRVRDFARTRGVKPSEIVDAIHTVLDAHNFDDHRSTLTAIRDALTAGTAGRHLPGDTSGRFLGKKA